MLFEIHHLLKIFVVIKVVNNGFFSGHSFLPVLSVRLHLHHNFFANGLSVLVIARECNKSLSFLFAFNLFFPFNHLVNYRIPGGLFFLNYFLYLYLLNLLFRFWIIFSGRLFFICVIAEWDLVAHKRLWFTVVMSVPLELRRFILPRWLGFEVWKMFKI